MKLRTPVRWVLLAALIGATITAGTAVWALVDSQALVVQQTGMSMSIQTAPKSEAALHTRRSAEGGAPSQPITPPSPAETAPKDEAALDAVMAEEVLEAIRAWEPADAERNMTNYKNLLSRLDVHAKFRLEVEQLLLGGSPVSDVLMAYEFLYHEYGVRSEIKTLVEQRVAGKTWEQILTAYRQGHAVFVPRSFEMNELEQWRSQRGMKSDDLMIADRLSFVTGKPFKEVMAAKWERKQSWKEVAGELDVLNTASALPRVPITKEQINRWTQPGKLTEEQVTEAFVLASRMGAQPEVVIEKLSSGKTREAVLAEGLASTYE